MKYRLTILGTEGQNSSRGPRVLLVAESDDIFYLHKISKVSRGEDFPENGKFSATFQEQDGDGQWQYMHQKGGHHATSQRR